MHACSILLSLCSLHIPAFQGTPHIFACLRLSTLLQQYSGTHNVVDCREYHSLTRLSEKLDCVCLMTPSLLLVPQISSLLQSILHIELVLSMSIVEREMQPSPMLQQLLSNADRYAVGHTYHNASTAIS